MYDKQFPLERWPPLELKPNNEIETDTETEAEAEAQAQTEQCLITHSTLG